MIIPGVGCGLPEVNTGVSGTYAGESGREPGGERIILVELIFVVILPGVWEGLERRGARGEQMLREKLSEKVHEKNSPVITGVNYNNTVANIFTLGFDRGIFFPHNHSKTLFASCRTPLQPLPHPR